MKRITLLLIAAALCMFAACGGGGDDDAAASSTPLPSASLTPECRELQQAIRVDPPEAGTLPDYDEAGDAFASAKSAAPDDIDDDLDVIAAGYHELADNLREAGLDAGEKVDTSNPERYADAFSPISDAGFRTSVSTLATWLGGGCQAS